MVRIKNIGAFGRKMFDLKLGYMIFIHYFSMVLKGKLSFKKYSLLIKRLSLLPSVVKDNKYVKVGNKTKIGLYIPEIPSKAYFTTCDKYLEFDKMMPCLTALISLTSRCRFKCAHCYQRDDIGKDVDIDILVKAVKRLQDTGTSYFTLEGGEPFFVYDRLKKMCEAIDERSEIWVYSTGDKMTLDRLKELKGLGLTAVSFSMHSPYANQLNKFMGSDKAWEIMEKGVELCHQADIPIAFNMCVSKANFYDGTFETIMEKVKDYNACMIQIIHPKPAGGWLHQDIDEFSIENLEYVKQLVRKYNHDKAYRDYPAISAQIMEEDKEVFGCTAGGIDRFYINAKGDVQPCEFINISFGNIATEDFDIIYERMRQNFETPGECWLCSNFGHSVSKVCHESKVTTLPLSPELSKQVYQNWDLGTPTKFYKKINSIR